MKEQQIEGGLTPLTPWLGASSDDHVDQALGSLREFVEDLRAMPAPQSRVEHRIVVRFRCAHRCSLKT